MLKREIVQLLRNSDILTTEERNVQTKEEKYILENEDEIIIEKSNVKNIRSVKTDTDLEFDVDLNYLSEDIVCKITLKNKVTGEVTVKYDFGSDKIFADMPRTDLRLSSYPRISVEEISKSIQSLSLGGKDFISNRMFSVTVFSENQEFIEEKIENIENLIMQKSKCFKNSNLVRPTSRGPILKTGNHGEVIIQKNIDLISSFEVKDVN